MDDAIIKDLQQEIRYLRHLLDANGIAYDYQAYRDALAAKEGEIEFPELSREHAIAFYGMFRGRKDVFAQRSAKKGYHTKCNNFWKYGICPKKAGEKVKCGECPNQDYTKLTVKTILDHLKGEKEDCTDVIGLYPLFPDGTCWFLVFDFDNHGDEDVEPSKDWQQEVDALRRICEVNGIDALVERSRSGRGAHVWVFFTEAIQASKVRRFGEALIMKGAESVSLKDFSFFDRMLPMQDFLPEGKIGNMVALPLQGRALKKGNSAFVDANWQPYKDQWGRLLSTQKISEVQIDKCLADWCPADGAMSVFQSDAEELEDAGTPMLFGRSPRPSLGHFNQGDVAGAMQIILSDGVYINKRNLKPRIQNAIRRIAAFSNSQFFMNLKMGFSNQDTPRIVYAGYDEGDYIVIPRGCLDDLKSLLDDAEISYSITDQRQEGRSIDVVFNGTLYPEQAVAAEKLLFNDNGVLAAATAFGKTVVGAYLIAQKKVNTLVLVHTVEIMNNWIRDLNKFLTINEPLPTYTTPKGRVKHRDSVIGTFSSQKDASTGIIDVAKEITDKEAALQQSLETLAKERSRELAGQGADTKALEQCETEIRELTVRLERIGTNKEVLFNYRKDKAEFFDKRDVFLSQKKAIEGKKDSLSERYKLRQRKEEDAVERLNEALAATKDQLKTLREGLQEADNFEQSNALPLLPQPHQRALHGPSSTHLSRDGRSLPQLLGNRRHHQGHQL